MAGILDGVRVLDFGHFVAGPLCAMLLADQGAEVIHIDPPGGPRFETPANAVWNRGKTCVELDLHDPSGRARALELALQTDVLIENFRPGVMDSLGLGHATLCERHPGLIYCSLPGFGHDDARCGLAAWEGVVAAATDTYRPEPGSPGEPLFWPLPVASNMAAFQAATACVMALIARERDGRGQHIEVPLFDAMYSLIGARGMSMPTPVQLSFDHIGFGVYRCADGRDVHFAPVAPRFMEWFVDAAGVTAWRTEGLMDRARLAEDPQHAAELRRRLRDLFASRPAAEWEKLANVAGAALSQCRTMGEWLQEPHALVSGCVLELQDPESNLMRQCGTAVRMDAQALQAAHTPQIGRRLAAGEVPHFRDRPLRSPCSKPADSSGPLSGIRVLDLTQIWAGPTAGRLLAEYGADVIKVNSPREPILTHEEVNRGKLSLLLDLNLAPDRALLERLVQRADVFMQNFAHGTADRLGIGLDAMSQIKPDLIYTSISAYGYGGPWQAHRGYEVQAQACVGAQAQFGRAGMARRLPYEINDYGTGILAAFAVGLGLLNRQRSKDAAHMQAALTYTAGLHQSLYLHDQPGAPTWDERGFGPWQRLYRTSDAWIFLGVSPRDSFTQRRILDYLQLAPARSEGELAYALENTLSSRDAAFWEARLHALGAGVHRLATLEEVMKDTRSRRRGLVITRHHPGLGDITMVGPVASLSRTPLVPGRVAGPPGSDRKTVEAQLEAWSSPQSKT